MPNVNKVVCGNEVVLDLSQDTLTDSSQVASGITAHTADGTQITGTGTFPSGSISIAQNGSYNISPYETMSVNVSPIPSSMEYCVDGSLASGSCYQYHLDYWSDDVKDYMFFGCNSLGKVDNINRKSRLGDYCFCGCQQNLSSISIPNVYKIGKNCFLDCSRLTSITIKNGVYISAGSSSKFATFNNHLYWSYYQNNIIYIQISDAITGTPTKTVVGSMQDSSSFQYVDGLYTITFERHYSDTTMFYVSWVVDGGLIV